MQENINTKDQEEIWNKILHFCNYRERCEAEVKKKLNELELDSQEKDIFLAKLRDLSMVDDARYAQHFCSGKFNLKHWGKNKIKQELLYKNIAPHYIEDALTTIDTIDYTEKIDRLLANKKKSIRAKNDHDLRMKLYRYLYFKGYEPEYIQQRLEKL